MSALDTAREFWGEGIPEFPRGHPGGGNSRPRRPRLRAMPDDVRDRLARIAEARADLLGPRGTTLCSMDEIAAMAAVCALHGVGPNRRSTPPSTGDANV